MTTSYTVESPIQAASTRNGEGVMSGMTHAQTTHNMNKKVQINNNYYNFRFKLLSVLNLLCNTTQTISITARDACYGCFFRAGNMPEGPAQIIALSQCATLYLNASAYQVCAVNLAVSYAYFDHSFNTYRI